MIEYLGVIGRMMNNTITNTFLNLAKEEALKSECKIKVGCIIFYKKNVISCGYNKFRAAKKLHPKFVKWKGSIHAEVDAILKARADLKGASLLVVRINNKGEMRLAKPCVNCMKYIEHVGIKKIYFSVDTNCVDEMDV